MAYDTLKIARQLTQAGLAPDVAEGVSATFADVLVDREDSLATKADIVQVEASIAKVEAKLSQSEALLRADMQAIWHELKSEIRATATDQLKWTVTGMVAVSGLLFAALKLTH